MVDIAKRLDELNPEKRRLLELLLKKERERARHSSAIRRQPRDGGEGFPLSFAQQRLWFIEQLEAGSALYNIPIVVRLVGALNLSALEQSLTELVRRHETLRTGFQLVEGEPVQVIHPPEPIAFASTDLSRLSEVERETEVRGLAEEEARLPFDLLTGRPLRVRLLKLSETKHVLLFTMHHIISDGWSLGVIIREVAALYEAFSRGEDSPLEELSIQYADYAVWQRERLTGEVLTEQLDYWKRKLDGAPEALELPTGRAQATVHERRAAHARRTLPAELTARLEELSRREGVTLFMLLLAAFKVLLSKYSGQEDIVVGSPIAGRTQPELEPLVGFFVNTLVLRTDLSEARNFTEALRRVSQTCLGAYAHQEVPFEKLVEELTPGRDINQTPLFQVVFMLQNTPRQEARLGGLTLITSDTPARDAKFELMLVAGQHHGRLELTLEYREELYEAITMARLLAHFEVLLADIVADPEQSLADLQLLTTRELRQLHLEWNRTEKPYPADSCIHELFREQAALTPETIAVTCAGEQLTYRELDRRSDLLAAYLSQRGVGADSVVGLCLERSVEMVVCVLGILKAGGAYLSLDATLPAERMLFMLRDAQAALLLTSEVLAGALPESYASPRVLIDKEWPLISALAAARDELHDACRQSRASSENLAYVSYTSGSTGVPKGVAVTHRNVMRLVCNNDYARFGADEVFLQYAPLAFDASTFELWGSLLRGGRLVVVPAGKPTLRELGEVIRDSGVTTLWLTAGLFHLMVDERMEDLRGVRQLLAGGDVLSVKHVQKFLSEAKEGSVLVNGYGPTESTTFACCHPLAGGTWDACGSVPIGRPIANTQVYILDRHLRPVPAGIAGELYIAGDGLARGYLNRPELTAERFLPDPFGAAGGRLYRTGDRARFLSDGSIEYLGRVDYQVKIRGFRIELGEIEAALTAHTQVAEAVVIAREDEAGDKRLVAYLVAGVVDDGSIVATAAGAVGARELRAHLAERLPDYMIPAHYVWLESLPLTPNGKVDRKALPAPGGGAGSADVETASKGAARTPIEEIVAGLFAAVLKVECVGLHDNFFELGGHSLLATQLISRVRETFDVEVPLRALFEEPTVTALAAAVETALRVATATDGTATAKAMPPLMRFARVLNEAGDEESDLPLSYAQQRLWFIDQLEPGSAAYNIPAAVRLTGALDVGALERALGEVVGRHEVLRTTFHMRAGEPVQVIHAAPAMTLPVTDLSQLPLDGREAEALRLADEAARRPFDLETGPLVRAELLWLNTEDHVLLLTMHHIVSDGWSLSVLVKEVAALYSAYIKGEESPLEELPMQYADYAQRQREWLTGDVLDRQVAYWREQLRGAPETLELPTDKPRLDSPARRGAIQNFRLPQGLVKKLEDLSRREGVTLYMLLLAAFQTLLSKYSGQEEVVVGSPIAGRTRREVEGLIGFFVNTLALRGDLRGDPSFREVLRRVREACLGAYAHQDVPFERLVEEVSPRRSLTHTPLFQVMFALQNESAIELEAPGLKLSSFGVKNEAAKFDLTLTLTASANGLAAEFSYQSELFDAGRIGRMWRHYVRVLEELTARPEQRLSEVEILTPGERLQQLLEWNETAREYPSELIHETFAAQAARMPRAVALVAGEQSVTYEELNALAELSATCLRQQGVRRGALVGVLMERSVEMVVALLGVLKAGAAYVPLDPSYPRERLAYMLKDSGACLLVTQRRLLDAGVLDAGATALPPVICLDGNWDELRAQVSTVSETPTLNDRPCGDDLAYVIYTSGSTGQPKGAAITHRGIRNHMCWMQENFPLDATHCVLQKTPFGFDASVWEFYAPLMSGARLVLARPGGHQDPSYLIETIDRHQVTTLQLVPSALRLLLEENALAQCTSLQRVFCGGEELTPDLQQRFYRLLPTAKLYNLYGPTEATIDATSHPCDATQQKVPIGRPVANTQIYILDRHLRPVPVGVPGELYIAGDGLARGYLNRPELTAERFLPDPFGAAGGRLYRTGDRARFLSDGSIEYLGRVDYQVKVRGFRIELGEVEAALAAHPQVNEAVVVAREDEAGDKQLVAYLIADQATAVFVESRELRAFLKEQLPDYMIPVHYVWLESFPLTPNGKVDRKALPAPDKTESASFGGYIAPQTPVQELLAGIWEGVLKVERVGITDNFFELGGHSLLAMLLASRVHEAFGVEVPLRTLFEEPTVTALATAVETALRVDVEQGTQTESAPPPLVRFEQPPGEEQTEQRELPLSYAQQRLWFIDQLEPESAAYNIPAAVRLTGEVDVAALERAIGEVVRRHEVLRTSFAMRAGEPVQVIHAAPAMTLPLTDISHLVREEREREAGRLAAEEAARPFNLGVWPLVRAELLKMGEDEHVLLLTMHHIVSDGWSFSVLIKEVSTLYAAYVKGEESPLAELPVQYADYARWQREWLTGEVLDRQVAYWREQLRGVPETLELPTDRVRAGESSHRGGTVRVQLEAGLTRRLKETSRREGVTLYMLLLAAFQTLLSKYSGQEEVVVGSPIAGRTRREVEGLIGFFVNTLALRGDLRGDPSFREVLRRVREACLGAYAHQDVPFERLVEEVSPRRSLTHTPLFQVMFALQNTPQGLVSFSRADAPREDAAAGELWLSAAEFDGAESHSLTAKFDLTLSMLEMRDGLEATLEYSTDLFERATVERILRHYVCLLEGVAADVGGRLSELRLMDELEESQLLRVWNDTARDYVRGRTAVQLFEEQAAKTPEAAAVVCGARLLSYGELNEQANRLAHYLSACGVASETIVAVMLDRSPELVVALLGILKAGGAYLPLDATHPSERLSYMIRDAGAKVLLTDERLREKAPAEPVLQVVCLDTAATLLAGQSRENVESRAEEDNLAYVIYTSGSTGRPKGVSIPHRGLSNLIYWHQQTYEVKPEHRATLLAGVGFDASVWELWPYITAGASVYIPDDEVRGVPHKLQQWLKEEEITICFLPTPVTESMLMLKWPREIALRSLLTGGDQLVRRPSASLGFEVINHYGPTEATVVATAEPVSPHDENGTLPPIGRPIANTQVYILDRHLRPVPAGIAGELYIAGDGLARGYLNRPELTAERFLPDPFGAAGGRLYRTGDRARFLGDGRIEYLGRVDHQVKVRGFRIELGEIEAALTAHTQVAEAVVIAREDEAGDKRLVAYLVAGVVDDGSIVATAAGAVGARELRAHLAERLPDYMIPAHYVWLESLPLTPNGKVDRKALPAPETTLRAEAGEQLVVAPRNEEELRLAEIWEEVLHRQPIDMTDNFFELGGHSLLAVQLFALIEERLHRKLPVAYLFKHSTIEHLAAQLRQHDSTPQSLLVKIQSGLRERQPLFLIHPVGGSVFCYVELARALGREQPLYAFQARGLNGEEAPHASIEEMSGAYLEELRRAQPEGPYLLGGWSMGGVVAFEMAQQLRAAGEEVSMLAMFDSYAPSALTFDSETDNALSLLTQFAIDLGLSTASLALPREQFLQLSASEQLSVVLDLAVGEHLLPAETGLARLHDRFSIFKNNLRAFRNYVPRPYNGRIALFAARDGATESAGKMRGWNKLAPRSVELYEVPGNHYTLLRQPHVTHIAARLTESLPDSEPVFQERGL